MFDLLEEFVVVVAFDFDLIVAFVAFAYLFFLSYFVNLAYFAYNIDYLHNMGKPFLSSPFICSYF